MRKIYVIENTEVLLTQQSFIRADYSAYTELKKRGAPVAYKSGLVCDSDDWDMFCYKHNYGNNTVYVFKYKGGLNGPNRRLQH